MSGSSSFHWSLFCVPGFLAGAVIDLCVCVCVWKHQIDSRRIGGFCANAVINKLNPGTVFNAISIDCRICTFICMTSLQIHLHTLQMHILYYMLFSCSKLRCAFKLTQTTKKNTLRAFAQCVLTYSTTNMPLATKRDISTHPPPPTKPQTTQCRPSEPHRASE